MGMVRWFFTVLVFLMMCVILCPLIKASAESPSPSFVKEDTFKPTMPTRPLPQDANNNGIADTLDQEIADKIASGESDEYVSVTVMLEYEPSNLELGAFALAGGNVTAGPWKYAIYGFGGSIQYDKINSFAQNCPDLVFIEKEAVFSIEPQYSAQIGVTLIPVDGYSVSIDQNTPAKPLAFSLGLVVVLTLFLVAFKRKMSGV